MTDFLRLVASSGSKRLEKLEDLSSAVQKIFLESLH
jgi:hypothetical protein